MNLISKAPRRYQFKKERRYWHDSYVEGTCSGCNFKCIPSCRYYEDKGRIDDVEALAEYERMKEKFPPRCLLSVRVKSLCDQCHPSRSRSLDQPAKPWYDEDPNAVF